MGEAGPGLAGSRVRAARRRGARRTARRPSTSTASATSSGSSARRSTAGWSSRCQDVCGGGLAVAIAEMCIWGDRGARLRLHVGDSPAVALFGESPSRLVCEVLPRHVAGVRAAGPPARPPGGVAGHDRRPAARIWSSPARAPPAPPRSAGAGSPTRSTWRSRTCGTPGSTGCRGRWAGSGCRPDVRRRRGRPAEPGPRGGGRRLDRAVRPPAPRPGVGGRRRRGRRPPDDLQGPRDGGPGPGRAADPVAQGRPRRRALPLLHHGLDGLGERPAHAPARAAARARHRPQREPRQHPRAPRAAGRRSHPPPREHRHGAPDRAPRRRAGGRHGRRAAQGPAARPGRVLAGGPRHRAGHRRPRPARLPAARSWGASRSPGTATPSLWGDDTGGWILASETAGARHHRRGVRARRGARRDRGPGAGPRAGQRPVRRGAPPRCACSS